MTKYTYTFSDGTNQVHYASSNIMPINMIPFLWERDRAIGLFKSGARVVKIELEHTEVSYESACKP